VLLVLIKTSLRVTDGQPIAKLCSSSSTAERGNVHFPVIWMPVSPISWGPIIYTAVQEAVVKLSLDARERSSYTSRY